MKKEKELFTTAMRGFDKEEVLLFLQELLENHARELEQAKQASGSMQPGQMEQIKAAFDQMKAEKERLQKEWECMGAELQKQRENGRKMAQYLRHCQKELAQLTKEAKGEEASQKPQT
ncbi:MAG: hypothetical protein RSC76_08310 [Oscillospiraceae bacterium]